MDPDTGSDGTRIPHERMWIVMEQEQKLELCIRRISEVCTMYELLGIIGRVTGSWICGVSKYGVRRERHGNEDTPGDLAPPEESTARGLTPPQENEEK